MYEQHTTTPTTHHNAVGGKILIMTETDYHVLRVSVKICNMIFIVRIFGYYSNTNSYTNLVFTHVLMHTQLHMYIDM